MAERRPLSPSLRFRILERDLFTCRYCGAKPPDVRLVVDHVHPFCRGGKDNETNLITACVTCNAGKYDRPLSDEARARIDVESARLVGLCLRKICELDYYEALPELKAACDTAKTPFGFEEELWGVLGLLDAERWHREGRF